MTRKIGKNIVLIESEPPRTCELCGNVEETRPYGPNGERVCFDCGIKDGPEALKERMARHYSAEIYAVSGVLEGESLENLARKLQTAGADSPLLRPLYSAARKKRSESN